MGKGSWEHNREDSSLPSGDLQFHWEPFVSYVVVVVVILAPLYIQLFDLQPNNRE